jgi:hypothetical protein
MKTVYLINAMIPRDLYDKGLKFLLHSKSDFRLNSNVMTGIYAWTTSKKYLDDFLTVRDKSIYKVIPIEFDDKEEFKSFKNDNKESMLSYQTFNSSFYTEKTKEVEILVTFNEYIQSTEYGEENMYEFGCFNMNLINYNIFKDKLIDDLDILNYTYEYDKRNENEEKELVDYNRSFGLTSRGSLIRFDSDNEVNILLHLFKFFFSGVEEREKP